MNHTDAALTHLCIRVFISLPPQSQMKINDANTEERTVMLHSKPPSLLCQVRVEVMAGCFFGVMQETNSRTPSLTEAEIMQRLYTQICTVKNINCSNLASDKNLQLQETKTRSQE